MSGSDFEGSPGTAGNERGVPPPPPSESAPPPPPSRASLHQTEQTRTYPCTSCGGELEFDIGEQSLTCPHCGSSQDIIEDAGRVVAEQDLHTALDELRSGALDRTQPRATDEKEVVCQNCGGHTTFVGTLTATRCPYCATPIQRDDIQDAPDRLAVDGVLPFTVDDDAAEAAIKDWISSRWFAPGEFKKYSTTGSFQSVYAAYFTYDADTESHYRGERGDNYTVTVGHGEDRRTEVRVRWSPRFGVVHNRFDDVTVLANTGFERRFVDRLEPWPTESAKPYSAEYVAGHLCRTYDRDVEQCFADAKQRMDDEIEHTVRRDIGGDQQRVHRINTSYRGLTFKHLLLPIWLLTVIYAGQTYQVFINGTTGEVHGERPYSKIKIAMAVLVAVVAIVVGVMVFRR